MNSTRTWVTPPREPRGGGGGLAKLWWFGWEGEDWGQGRGEGEGGGRTDRYVRGHELLLRALRGLWRNPLWGVWRWMSEGDCWERVRLCDRG